MLQVVSKCIELFIESFPIFVKLFLSIFEVWLDLLNHIFMKDLLYPTKFLTIQLIFLL